MAAYSDRLSDAVTTALGGGSVSAPINYGALVPLSDDAINAIVIHGYDELMRADEAFGEECVAEFHKIKENREAK